MPSVKVSTKHQISLPSDARRQLGIRPGDRLTVDVVDDALVLRRRPGSASERLWGLGRGMYGTDAVTFVRRLREETEARVREREALVPGRSGHGRRPGGARQQRPDLPPGG